jgi:hypothetical protein
MIPRELGTAILQPLSGACSTVLTPSRCVRCPVRQAGAHSEYVGVFRSRSRRTHTKLREHAPGPPFGPYRHFIWYDVADRPAAVVPHHLLHTAVWRTVSSLCCLARSLPASSSRTEHKHPVFRVCLPQSLSVRFVLAFEDGTALRRTVSDPRSESGPCGRSSVPRAFAESGNAAIGSRAPIGRAWSCRNPFGRHASF